MSKKLTLCTYIISIEILIILFEFMVLKLMMQGVIVVTGGASGIGFSIAKRLSRAGKKVIVLDINKVALKKSVEELGTQVVGYHCDVSDEFSVEQTLDDIFRNQGNIAVLVNNAGISINKSLSTTTLEDWNKVMDTNLTGIFLTTKSFVKQLNDTDNGLIINIASVSGMVGMPNYLAYNVSKAGVIELTKSLAIELAPQFRVNAICPGYVLTSMQEKEYTPAELESCAESNPLKRLARPDEIAAMVEYLISVDATYINGSALVIDGGEIAGGLTSKL